MVYYLFVRPLISGNLFLYESEEQVDVKHVIVLQHFITSIVYLVPNLLIFSGHSTLKIVHCFSKQTQFVYPGRTPKLAS